MKGGNKGKWTEDKNKLLSSSPIPDCVTLKQNNSVMFIV